MDDIDDISQNSEVQVLEQERLTIEQENEDKSWATFSFQNEEHTLGNLLRNTLIKNKNVEFCGYSVPHPNEPIMNVRVHTTGKDAREVVKGAFKRIIKSCDVITEKFNEALKEYDS